MRKRQNVKFSSLSRLRWLRLCPLQVFSFWVSSNHPKKFKHLYRYPPIEHHAILGQGLGHGHWYSIEYLGLLGAISKTTLQRSSLIAKAPQSRANSITVVSRPTFAYRIPIYGFSGVCRALGSSWQRIVTFAQSHTAQTGPKH